MPVKSAFWKLPDSKSVVVGHSETIRIKTRGDGPEGIARG
jgi:hypothetical protein